jgi:hypothetical protein
MITYEIPLNAWYHIVLWENYYLDYTWEQMSNTWNA